MRFNPKTEKQLQEDRESRLLPKGMYDCEVEQAMDDISKKSGNEMIHLVLRVYGNGDEKGRQVHCYLLEAMPELLFQACHAFDLQKEYEAGALEAWMFGGKTARALIGVRPADEQYPAKNTVNRFNRPGETETGLISGEKPRNRASERMDYGKSETKTSWRKELDDEIPF